MTDIVRSVMAEEGLFTDCVPNIYRIQDVFGTSRCYCPRCSRVWTSHMTWVKFDLRSQRILKNWKQMCVVCNSHVNPYVNSEELERMAKLAVERCVALTNGSFVLRSSNRRTPPHNVLACEKCREGGKPCWVIKQKVSGSESSSQAPSVAGSASDSDVDAISDDISKLLVSTDSSQVSSRAESPNTAEQEDTRSKSYRHYQQQPVRNPQPVTPSFQQLPQYAYYGPGYATPYQYPAQSPPVFYQDQMVYPTQPTWFHQQPAFSTVPLAQWY